MLDDQPRHWAQAAQQKQQMMQGIKRRIAAPIRMYKRMVDAVASHLSWVGLTTTFLYVALQSMHWLVLVQVLQPEMQE